MQTQKAGAMPAQRVWRFDPVYSTVEFSITRFFFFTVKGSLNGLEGVIVLDEEDVSRSTVTATIKAASLDTGNKRRDAHLRSREFFDAEEHPLIEFKSVSVSRGRDRDSLDLQGDLTIKGKTSRVALAVNEMDRSRSPRGEEFVYYTAATELDRFALGINAGGALIGRKLKITINVQAIS